jgi:hypothetical protein
MRSINSKLRILQVQFELLLQHLDIVNLTVLPIRLTMVGTSGNTLSWQKSNKNLEGWNRKLQNNSMLEIMSTHVFVFTNLAAM